MRIMRSRRVRWVFLALVLVGVGVGVYKQVGKMGAAARDAWVAAQIRSSINDVLVPELTFRRLTYQEQGSHAVVLEDVCLLADDPDNPAQPMTVFRSRRVQITFARPPGLKQPPEIASIQFLEPVIHLARAQKNGAWVGFSPMFEPGGLADLSAAEGPAQDALKIGRIDLQGARVVIDRRGSGAAPLEIDGLEMRWVAAELSQARYGGTVTLSREPGLKVQAEIELDPGTRVLEVTSLGVTASVSEPVLASLPPATRSAVQAYEIRGEIEASASGRMAWDAWREMQFEMAVDLTQGHAALGGCYTPVDRLHVAASTAQGVATIQRISVQALDGWLRGDGVLQLAEGYPLELQLGWRDLEIGHLFARPEDAAPGLAGRMQGQATLRTALADPLQRVSGRGRLSVRQGRLDQLAPVSHTLRFMSARGDLTAAPGAQGHAGKDRADLAFELRGDHVHVLRWVSERRGEYSQVVGPWYAIRPRGNLYFDRRLDLHINAGALERVQSSLGPLGSAMGMVTDSLLTYHVGGVWGRPRVRAVPLGGLLRIPEENE